MNTDNVQKKLTSMLLLQGAMNYKVDPEWETQNWDWYRAMWLECAEAIEYMPWKWWKKQEPNLDAVRMELVDIWHFILSQTITDHKQQELYTLLTTTPQITKEDNLEQYQIDWLELIASRALTKSLPQVVSLFMCALHAFGMSFDDLHAKYVGKNILNMFRQNHGYKTGGYIKIWNGFEDNEVLERILKSLDSISEDYPDRVYFALSEEYALVKKDTV